MYIYIGNITYQSQRLWEAEQLPNSWYLQSNILNHLLGKQLFDWLWRMEADKSYRSRKHWHIENRKEISEPIYRENKATILIAKKRKTKMPKYLNKECSETAAYQAEIKPMLLHNLDGYRLTYQLQSSHSAKRNKLYFMTIE